MMIPSAQLRQRANWSAVGIATAGTLVGAWIEAGALFGASPTQARIAVLPVNDISAFSALYSTWALPLILVALVLMTTLFGAIILTGQTSLEGDRAAVEHTDKH
jgi:NADH:ubiquinone oxidoreductase subunit 6 (subunit J)